LHKAASGRAKTFSRCQVWKRRYFE